MTVRWTVGMLVKARLFVCVAMLLATATASAQTTIRLPADRFRDGRAVRTAFKDVVAQANEATVRIFSEGKELALGTVIGPNGWIITKYSELRAPLTCRLADGRIYAAEVVGHHPQYDLAMLKIDAKDLKSVVWAETPKSSGSDDKKLADVGVGRFVATAAPGDLPRAVGVVSVPLRKIPPRAGVLGVRFEPNQSEPKITEVFPGSGAEQAGLKAGDIITKVADSLIESREKLVQIVRKYRAGDTVTLSIRRGDEDVQITATLSPPGTVGEISRADRMNSMGGPLSVRSADFPVVLQHDTVLRPVDCGGPLVDLTGKVVGVNIARAGRTETYAIPTEHLLPLLADLMCGRLAPKNPLPGAQSPGQEAKKVEPAKAAGAF